MKTIKVSEATGAALDHLVMLCEGWIYEPESARPAFFRRLVRNVPQYRKVAAPVTTDWSQGGPIIEREGISSIRQTPTRWVSEYSNGCDRSDHARSWGPTPLIAAMRCYCTSKLGGIVEVPEELL